MAVQSDWITDSKLEDEMIVLDENNILLDSSAESSEQAIRLAADCLYRNGYIGTQYVEDVLEREKSYPTGLPTDDVITALPHAKSGDVLRTGVSAVRLLSPVEFGNMADSDEKLPVELIFMLANASGADSHLEDLQELMECFSRVGLLRDLKAAETPAEFARIFAAWETYPES